VLTACGGSDGGTKVGPTTSVAPPTIARDVTTTSGVPGPTNPEGVAKALLAAWKAGDRTAAARAATPAAAGELFARPYATNTAPTEPWTFRECQVQTPGAAAVCTFTGQNTELDMHVGSTGPGQPLLVIDIRFRGTGATP
jgi:hypothetical protein